MINIKLIEQLQKDLHQLKSIVVQQLDQFIGNTDEWRKQLLLLGQQNVTYSFFNELEKIIKQNKFDEFNQKYLIDQIISINQSWNQKIYAKLNQYKQFEECQKCEELLKDIEKVNLIQEKQQADVKKFDNQQNQLEQYQIMDQQIELKLIDVSNQYFHLSYAIVFDKTGQIMISSDETKVIIWNFEKGKFKLNQSYQVHLKDVTCFVYSQQSNNFISGSNDANIICWQQINDKEWKYSQPFQQHNSYINCLILNKQENQLISGGNDYSIKIWKPDFLKNDLTFLYHLDSNSNYIYSISLNQSETIMASCGLTEFIIWEKGLQEKWEFKYKQSIPQIGNKVYFMNNQQLLWVTQNQENDILIFELQDGIFNQNSKKTIQLNKNNNKCEDFCYFPIIYNKNKNILLIRHKHHIYLIRELKDCTFNIMASLHIQNEFIFGTITNDGQYLVFWDDKSRKYSSYEIKMK
ncbi:unnamed protein product [Paramecium primaurelia]|uniref:WD40-repeat-containing domain n=1 Tax=Paramecium primaurelia TaxID=5886 RepID=A0A8S1PZW4_PARPR|nr:unnamed protein product [Paramecium primaurelia]